MKVVNERAPKLRRPARTDARKLHEIPMSLASYKAKRDFRRTPEPAAPKAAQTRGKAQLKFVIQKHAARRLHYDLRLELDGTLKSWAVPKGLPLRKGDKRLAVHVEDHPLEYGTFEGSIPPGNYGAGTVMVWDFGTYEPIGTQADQGLRAGKLVVHLQGQKLKGEWTLVRLRPRNDKDENAWLVIKTDKDAPKISARTEDSSAQSGRSMQQIASLAGHPAEEEKPAARASSPRVSAVLRKGTEGNQAKRATKAEAKAAKTEDSAPEFVEPMKALLVDKLPAREEWLFEVKLDGIRAIAIKNGERLQLVSRRPRDLTASYPDIVASLRELPVNKVVLDGEIVALDKEGRPSFQLLQNLKRPGEFKPPILYYVFDVIHCEGRDLRHLSLTERKEVLERLLPAPLGHLRLSATLDAPPSAIWQQVQQLGLEGVIAKRRDSAYQAGARTGAWLKIKAQNEQEFVIGGYTSPEGSRIHFGSVLVGYYADGKLIFASRVGTGFSSASLQSLYALFQKYKTSNCPFANLPTAGREGKGMTRSEMRRCQWLKPELVCQVKFLEWTHDGILRQPVFLGLREDKDPPRVVREKPKVGVVEKAGRGQKGGESHARNQTRQRSR